MIHSYLGGSDIPSWFLSSEIFALAINLWFLLFTGSFPQTPPFLRDLHIPFPSSFAHLTISRKSFPCFTASSVVPWSWPCSARCASSDLRSWCPSDFSHATRSPTDPEVVGRWWEGSGAPVVSPQTKKGSKVGRLGINWWKQWSFFCDLKNWCCGKNMVHTSFRSRCLWTYLCHCICQIWKLCWDPSNPPWPTMMSDYHEG